MDMSKIVYPLIAVAVIGGAWLLTSGGVNWRYNNLTKATVGEDEDKDIADERGLSKLAGFLLGTLRYERAATVYQTAIDRYPNGKNVWWNLYQLARCQEKMELYEEAVVNLDILRTQDADSFDERVPDFDNLNMRIQKLVEVHEIPGYY